MNRKLAWCASFAAVAGALIPCFHSTSRSPECARATGRIEVREEPQPRSVVVDSVARIGPAMASAAPGDALVNVRCCLARWSTTSSADEATQDAITREALALLTRENIAGVMAGLTAEEFNTPFGSEALELWLRFDPLLATRWVAARRDARDENAMAVAKALVASRAEVFACSDALPRSDWKESMLRHASEVAICVDRSKAIDIAARITSAEVRADAFETIAYEWFGCDADGALRWAQSVEDPALRMRLVAVGAKAIAIRDPDLAAQWLGTSMPDEGPVHDGALSVVGLWAARDPVMAAEWVARLSAGTTRIDAIQLVLADWQRTSPSAARAWMETLPDRAVLRACMAADAASGAMD